MKTTHSHKKLMAYSVSASCFILLNNPGSAQIVYSDINPDIILDDEDVFYLDVDGDGIDEFKISNYSFKDVHSTEYKSFSWSNYVQAFVMHNLINTNAICGISSYINTYSSGYIRYLPYALDRSSSIGAFRSFQNQEFQLLALRFLFTLSADPFETGGFWLSDMDDHFIGFQIKDAAKDLHYGWIRCNLSEDGQSLTIKDYAVQETPGVIIKAGLTTEIDEMALEATIYSQNTNLYFSFNRPPNEAVAFSIYNLSGQLVFKSDLTNRYSWFDFNLPDGNYVFELKSEEINKSIAYYIAN